MILQSLLTMRMAILLARFHSEVADSAMLDEGRSAPAPMVP